MALSNFFRINMPYGMQKAGNNSWFVFNREYLPLGWNSVFAFSGDEKIRYSIATKYKGLTDFQIEKIVVDPKYIRRDENGKIVKVFFYGGKTDPLSNSGKWEEYFEKMKKLSSFQVNHNR